MILQDVWDILATIGKKAWGAVGATSAFVSLIFTVFYKDVLDKSDIPQWFKDFSPLITLLLCILIFSAVMLLSKIIIAWQERGGQVHVADREQVIYRARRYKPGSDLLELSRFASAAFDGDTMKPEIVQHAVKIGAATGLCLMDADGKNVGFLDVFHFTNDVMEKWKNGEISEDALRKEDFRRIPAKGDRLDLAMGAIYLRPGVERGLAHQFANQGESFLRNAFPKFRQIDIYATIFKPDGERIAKAYRFEISKKAKDRTGRYAGGHDLRLRTIKLKETQRMVGGVGGRREVYIDFVD